MSATVEQVVIEKDSETQIILGQGTFNLLSIEELFRAVAMGAPGARFGIAFCEATDERLIRHSGNDERLISLAIRNSANIGCGHSFLILIEGAYPLQVLNNVKSIQTVVNVLGATGNECSVVVARLHDQNALLGFADGLTPTRPETVDEQGKRQAIVRKIGYLEQRRDR